MDEYSDEELITSFQNGDESAFNKLVLRYQERIYWTIRRFVGHHDDADDILQDVFIRVYNSLNEFRGESNFFTWLYRISVNVSLNFLKKRKIRMVLRIDESISESVASGTDPVLEYEEKEKQEIIRNAIEKLPLKQKTVFVLRFYEQLSYEEISKILKISIGGLKANYFHAIKKIEEYVRRQEK
jgi:RNA polymerase sigma-70 factor (ECF subfamily)